MTYLPFAEEIEGLGASQGRYKPHKHIAVLAAIQSLKSKPENGRCVYYDEQFKESFSEIFLKYAGEDDRDRSYTPFFI